MYVAVDSDPQAPHTPTSDGKHVFCCLDCADLTGWRRSGTNEENRVMLWKTASAVGFFLWMYVLYFDTWGFASALGLVGIVLTVKVLIEIWGQDTPTWLRPGGWKLFVLIYGIGFPSFLYTINLAASQPPDIELGSQGGILGDRLVVGFVLYLFGSLYSLSYELHRFWFKRQPQNKGRLHTTGFAALCIHPNYFGDFFTYTGWALVIGNKCALGSVLFILPNLVFCICPNSDAYLAHKYPEEFPDYAAKVATLVPFLHSQAILKVFGLVLLVAGAYLSMSCPGM